MASEEHVTVSPDDDLEDDDDSQSHEDDDLDNEDVLAHDDDEDDEEDNPSFSPAVASPTTTIVRVTPAPTCSSFPAVTVAVPISSVMTDSVVLDRSVIDKRQRVGLFQRLWTDEDEKELLQGFLEYTTQRGGNAHHHDTTMFYDQIKSKLQLDFNKNQLVEKLRRLKKKYRTVVSKMGLGKDFSFKSPHDQATFDISRKIWSTDTTALDEDEGNPNSAINGIEVKAEYFVDKKTTPKSRKRSRPPLSPVIKVEDLQPVNEEFVSNTVTTNTNNTADNNANMSILVEETARSCLAPLLKELMSGGTMGITGVPSVVAGMGLGGLTMNTMSLSFGSGGGGGGEVMDERWTKQQIVELEVYSKRLELVQDQIRAALEDLRSTEGR